MIIGMSVATFTLLHVLISLVGIVAGLVAMIGWLKSDPSRIPTSIFLTATILTSITGFLFPFSKLLPSHIVGMISLPILAVATFALYGRQLSGVWRPIYTVTATLSLCLNVFVLIASLACLKVFSDIRRPARLLPMRVGYQSSATCRAKTRLSCLVLDFRCLPPTLAEHCQNRLFLRR
jgi:hypothetical protein